MSFMKLKKRNVIISYPNLTLEHFMHIKFYYITHILLAIALCHICLSDLFIHLSPYVR